uniref:Nuclear transcription factor Y subunit n=1 Tax=Macrostomum lignano TaxID=282301 RepID=A0A1I8FHP3_9PLAT
RPSQEAQVFLNDSDFDSLIVLLNQFYRLRDVHNAITSEILKPIYRYYYLYFSQDKQHQRAAGIRYQRRQHREDLHQLRTEEGDQRRFAPKPFGKEEKLPARTAADSGAAAEDWQLEHRPVRQGDGGQAYCPADDDEDGGMLRGRRLRGSQRQRQRLAAGAESGPTFPKRFGGMVNNYLSARDDHYLQQRVDSYWEQEAALERVAQTTRGPARETAAEAAAPTGHCRTPIASSRFQEASSGRYS